jgi:hypothetical protein
MPMKLSSTFLIPLLLVTAGCQPSGHSVQQTMFHKDVILHIAPSDFKETNHRTIRALPHTWVNIKRISVVLDDGTVVPCRDFQSGAFELTHDEHNAFLIGTLELPVKNVTQVIVVVGQEAQCTGAQPENLSPCTLIDAKSTDDSQPANAVDGEITLRYIIPGKDRDSPRLVLQLPSQRGRDLPTTPIKVSLMSSGTVPASVDAIQTPWMSLSGESGSTPNRVPYRMTSQATLPDVPIQIKGTFQPETRIFTPSMLFNQGIPERIVIGGTVKRLDIAKRTFQLRVDDASDGQPYAALHFRVSEQTSYAFAGTLPATPATFDDISIGRRIWVSVLSHPNQNDHVEALDVRISSIDH